MGLPHKERRNWGSGLSAHVGAQPLPDFGADGQCPALLLSNHCRGQGAAAGGTIGMYSPLNAEFPLEHEFSSARV